MVPLNWKLFNKVIRHIKAEPKRLWMPSWINAIAREPVTEEEKEFYPPCGTTACMAGWAVLLTTPKKQWTQVSNVEAKATKRLGLTILEADHIFTAGTNFRDRELQMKALFREIGKVRNARIAAGEKSAAKIKL